MPVNERTLASEKRLHWLERKLSEEGSLRIAAAAEALDVSEMTIRRDLAELEERGTARRVRGGARAIGPQSFAERSQVAARAKSRIAAKLAELLPAVGAVALDASSTVKRLCAMVSAVRDLTVLTNGPDAFAAIRGVPGVTPMLTGGRLDERTGSLVGPLACHAATQLTVQTFFTSAAAVDVRIGSLEPTLEEAEVKRCMAASAQEVVLAVDSSKLGARALAAGLDWMRVDLLVTELDPTDTRLDPYRELVQLL